MPPSSSFAPRPTPVSNSETRIIPAMIEVKSCGCGHGSPDGGLLLELDARAFLHPRLIFLDAVDDEAAELIANLVSRASSASFGYLTAFASRMTVASLEKSNFSWAIS